MGRKRLKYSARQIMMERRKPNLFVVTILYVLIILMLGMLNTNLSDFGQFQTEFVQSYSDWLVGYTEFGSETELVRPVLRITAMGVFFYVACTILRWMMDLGYVYYARGVTRDEQMHSRSLFEGFNYFFKGLGVRLIYELLFWGGMLLLFVPGLIFSCMYSQVFLLLLDNPDKGVIWCFRQSRQLMRGKKMNYFVLRLSFFGWEILRMMPVIGYAADVWVMPYVEITMVNYYHTLIGRDDNTRIDGWERPGMF